MTDPIRRLPKLRIGLFGIGLAAYWSAPRLLAQVVLFAPDRKFDDGARISPPGIGIPYIGCEELNETPSCILVGCEELWEYRSGGNSDNVLGHAPYPQVRE